MTPQLNKTFPGSCTGRLMGIPAVEQLTLGLMVPTVHERNNPNDAMWAGTVWGTVTSGIFTLGTETRSAIQ